MRYDCLINITHKTHFVHISDTVEVLVHYVNTGKETLSPFIDSSIDNVLLQTNPGCTQCTSRFLTSQTFLDFIW